jgi:hypothetical protein
MVRYGAKIYGKIISHTRRRERKRKRKNSDYIYFLSKL